MELDELELDDTGEFSLPTSDTTPAAPALPGLKMPFVHDAGRQEDLIEGLLSKVGDELVSDPHPETVADAALYTPPVGTPIGMASGFDLPFFVEQDAPAASERLAPAAPSKPQASARPQP